MLVARRAAPQLLRLPHQHSRGEQTSAPRHAAQRPLRVLPGKCSVPLGSRPVLGRRSVTVTAASNSNKNKGSKQMQSSSSATAVDGSIDPPMELDDFSGA